MACRCVHGAHTRSRWLTAYAVSGRGRADDIALQGNVDPIILFSDKESISAKVKETVRKGRAAGGSKHVLNLGHGVLVGTPEESVAHFFETNRNTLYKDL
jgi:uroporphyrinogen decarboxylase